MRASFPARQEGQHTARIAQRRDTPFCHEVQRVSVIQQSVFDVACNGYTSRTTKAKSSLRSRTAVPCRPTIRWRECYCSGDASTDRPEVWRTGGLFTKSESRRYRFCAASRMENRSDRASAPPLLIGHLNPPKLPSTVLLGQRDREIGRDHRSSGTALGSGKEKGFCGNLLLSAPFGPQRARASASARTVCRTAPPKTWRAPAYMARNEAQVRRWPNRPSPWPAHPGRRGSRPAPRPARYRRRYRRSNASRPSSLRSSSSARESG